MFEEFPQDGRKWKIVRFGELIQNQENNELNELWVMLLKMDSLNLNNISNEDVKHIRFPLKLINLIEIGSVWQNGVQTNENTLESTTFEILENNGLLTNKNPDTGLHQLTVETPYQSPLIELLVRDSNTQEQGVLLVQPFILLKSLFGRNSKMITKIVNNSNDCKRHGFWDPKKTTLSNNTLEIRLGKCWAHTDALEIALLYLNNKILSDTTGIGPRLFVRSRKQKHLHPTTDFPNCSKEVTCSIEKISKGTIDPVWLCHQVHDFKIDLLIDKIITDKGPQRTGKKTILQHIIEWFLRHIRKSIQNDQKKSFTNNFDPEVEITSFSTRGESAVNRDHKIVIERKIWDPEEPQEIPKRKYKNWKQAKNYTTGNKPEKSIDSSEIENIELDPEEFRKDFGIWRLIIKYAKMHFRRIGSNKAHSRKKTYNRNLIFESFRRVSCKTELKQTGWRTIGVITGYAYDKQQSIKLKIFDIDTSKAEDKRQVTLVFIKNGEDDSKIEKEIIDLIYANDGITPNCSNSNYDIEHLQRIDTVINNTDQSVEERRGRIISEKIKLKMRQMKPA